MYEYCDKAQDFVNEWTTRLRLPTIWVKVLNKKDFTAGIIPDSSVILINPETIDDRQVFVTALLHEICHWWHYWKFNDNKYEDESRVISVTADWIRQYYPSYFKPLLTRYARIVRKCEKYVSENLTLNGTEHYYGFIKVLIKYGVITDVRKVTK